MARKKKQKENEVDSDFSIPEPIEMPSVEATPEGEPSRRFAAKVNFRYQGKLYSKGEEVPASCMPFMANGVVYELKGSM